MRHTRNDHALEVFEETLEWLGRVGGEVRELVPDRTG